MKATLVTCVAMQMLFGLGCVASIDGNDSDDSATEDDETSIETVARCDNDHDHDHDRVLPNGVPFRNESGFAATVSTTGSIDLTNPFFQDLGTNGRRCVSCHQPATGWTVTPEGIRDTFERTRGGTVDDGTGAGAIFRLVDGANSPTADVSTLAKRRQAYSMLLNKGLIRVGLPVPATAEFELVAVDDPYKFASAAELSLFRRPLPTANLKFDSTVMWDGREVVPGMPVVNELQTQSSDATT